MNIHNGLMACLLAACGFAFLLGWLVSHLERDYRLANARYSHLPENPNCEHIWVSYSPMRVQCTRCPRIERLERIGKL